MPHSAMHCDLYTNLAADRASQQHMHAGLLKVTSYNQLQLVPKRKTHGSHSHMCRTEACTKVSVHMASSPYCLLQLRMQSSTETAVQD